MIDWKKMTLSEIWSALKSRPSILGPWRKHDHGGWCDCGRDYPNGYWYREDIDGNEFVVLADTTTDIDADYREREDDRLRNAGYLLLDENP